MYTLAIYGHIFHTQIMYTIPPTLVLSQCNDGSVKASSSIILSPSHVLQVRSSILYTSHHPSSVSCMTCTFLPTLFLLEIHHDLVMNDLRFHRPSLPDWNLLLTLISYSVPRDVPFFLPLPPVRLTY